MGSIVGGVFMAMIPDGFLGRKQLLFYTTLAMSLTGISIFFSTSIWTYAFLKFAIGVARSHTGTYAFNLIGERVSTKWRPRATMSLHVGFMYKETTKKPFKCSKESHLEREVTWRQYRLVIEFLLEMLLSEALNAMVELPTFVITPILLEKFSRRSSVLVNCLVGGALGVFCFVLTTLGRTNMAFVFELGFFFCARIRFNLTAVYLIEMFPTCVRNFATTMLRQALVIGGACCPIIASVGRNVPSISFAVFGFRVCCIGSRVFCFASS
ncbi:hypothetical protein DY000_02062145 [Brassica cretica]|uniref:Major facilitator superfamily (MFS) profile domain-containing protein n=1 Tax=Brassica cretica TaxID=69181 RepID=A0ABQ7AZR1_BRACR|nr:hypothetical protein DY000_02062145 [Brassica cretica]